MNGPRISQDWDALPNSAAALFGALVRAIDEQLPRREFQYPSPAMPEWAALCDLLEELLTEEQDWTASIDLGRPWQVRVSWRHATLSWDRIREGFQQSNPAFFAE